MPMAITALGYLKVWKKQSNKIEKIDPYRIGKSRIDKSHTTLPTATRSRTSKQRVEAHARRNPMALAPVLLIKSIE